MLSRVVPGAPSRLGERATYAVLVLAFVNLLNAFDRNMVAVVAEPIRHEWSLSDTQLGLLSSAFMLVYALAAVPFGRLADVANRARIIAASVFVWSILTAMGGIARAFWQLLVLRIGVGLGESTFLPASVSLLGDRLSPTTRSRAMSIVMTGVPLGVASSFALGGVVAHRWGWRASLFLALAPGLAAALLARGIREPPREVRRRSDGAAARPGSPVREALSIPTVRTIVGAAMLQMFGIFSLAAFTSPLLMRYHGLSIDRVGAYSGLMLGVAPVLGLVLGGVVSDAVRKRRTDAPLLVSATSVLASVPFMLLALLRPRGDILPTVVFLGLALVNVFPFIGLAQAAIQDVVRPSLRGIAAALFAFGMNLLGALGPIITGAVSDALARRAAHDAGIAELTERALEPFRAVALRDALFLVPVMSLLVGALVLSRLGLARRDAARLASSS